MSAPPIPTSLPGFGGEFQSYGRTLANEHRTPNGRTHGDVIEMPERQRRHLSGRRTSRALHYQPITGLLTVGWARGGAAAGTSWSSSSVMAWLTGLRPHTEIAGLKPRLQSLMLGDQSRTPEHATLSFRPALTRCPPRSKSKGRTERVWLQFECAAPRTSGWKLLRRQCINQRWQLRL